jgi:lysylphosphatidylglycerol synthetase-like protein (DUF2156 family)
MKLKESLWMALASMGTGLILSLFSVVRMPLSALLSLTAVALIIFYFRKNERRALRIGFIIFSVLFYFLFIFLIAVYFYTTSHLPSG